MSENNPSAPTGGHIARHSWIDRLFHWFMAISILVLIGTAFLPIWGLQFPWVVPHWITGVILIILVAFHTIRALFFQDLRSVWIWIGDFVDLWRAARAMTGKGEAPKSGKYSFAQKSYHMAITVLVLASCVTGGFMLVKQDTPLWRRNPYWLSDDQWGLVYVFHGFAAIVIFAMLLIHIYFAIRPEKRFYTRSMIKGWITEDEFKRNHDPKRWHPGDAQSELQSKKGE